MDYIETIAKLLGTNELGVIIVFLFGYLSLRYILEKNIKELHEIDKIIFGTSIGVISFIILRELFILLLGYINIIFYLKISLDGLKITSMLYLIFIFSIISLSLVFKELKDILNTKKRNLSNTNIIKRLQNPIKNIFNLFLIVSIITIIVSITSYFTTQKIISGELLKISLVFFIITFFIYNYYCISRGKNIENELLSVFKKIKKNITIKKIVIIIISIITINLFIFPSIQYSPEIITNYGYNVEANGLSNNIIKNSEINYFEKIEQDITLKRIGNLGWIPIENKGHLIDNSSIKKLKPELKIYSKSSHDEKYIGITNKLFDENYNSFIIEFDKLNKSDIESITLTGYRKINLDKSSLDININTEEPNKIKLNMTNNLNKPIELLDNKIIKTLNSNNACSFSQENFETYYKGEKKQTFSPTISDNSITLHSETIINKKNEIIFEIKDDYILLVDFKITPDTRFEIILDINCK